MRYCGSTDQSGQFSSGHARFLVLSLIAVVICSMAGCASGESLAWQVINSAGGRTSRREPELIRRIGKMPLHDVREAMTVLLSYRFDRQPMVGELLTYLELRGDIEGRPFGDLDSDIHVPSWLPELLESAQGAYGFKAYILFDIAAFHTEPRPILRASARSEESLVRRAAIHILTVSANPLEEDVELIVSALSDKDAEVRARAMLGVVRLDVKTSVDELAGLLDDRTVIRALPFRDMDWTGVRTLDPHDMDGVNREVRCLAAWAIQEISDNDYGFVNARDSGEDIDRIVARIRADRSLVAGPD
jgi:hypothetical protein